MEESVRIVNQGDETLNLVYDNRVYTLAPGESRFFPRDVMIAWMGDATLRNTTYDKWRDMALDNLVTLHGGGAATIRGEDPYSYFPALVAYDSNDNPIPTLITDPEGKHLTATPAAGSNEELLLRKINELEARIEGSGTPKPTRAPRRKKVSSDHTDAPPEPITDAQPPADEPDIIKVG